MADAYDELRQTLITRIEGMIHDVQREIHANNVEHETLDGLSFRGEQLQYSSEILKHLCNFPLPNVDLGFAVISVLQNTRGSTLGKERGAFD